VTLIVFNMLGQHVATLVDDVKSAGVHTATFEASRYASGMYLVQMRAGSFIQVRKMVLLK